jgi:hypothetical protein
LGNNGKQQHAFAKFFRQDKHEKNGNGGKQKGRDNDQLRDDCGNEYFPMGTCSVCGQFLKKERHHIISRWISRTLTVFGIFIPEAQETIDVCPRCHRKVIERVYRLFTAVLLIRYKKQLAEIVSLCIQGKRNFTFEELSVLADGGSLVDCIANEQPVVQEVEVKT